MIAPDWKGQIWTPILKRLSVKKVVLGNAEDILEKGSLMRKKDLCLPPGNMAVHILLERDWILEDLIMIKA
jgi:hypothetical protein